MYKYAIVLLALTACAVINAKPKDDTQYLDGEYGVPISKAPYAVSIQRKKLFEYEHICNGAITSSTIIITSAQCLYAVKGTNFKVRVGSTYWNTGGTLESVKSFKIHENYNPKTHVYDIGIIRLVNSVPFTIDIQPVLLAYGTPDNYDFASIAGWATVNEDVKKPPKTLQYSLAQVINGTGCSVAPFGYGNEVQMTMICARGVNSCMFGYGGPMIVGLNLAGIASWSNGCGNPIYPGVYTNIASVRQWILDNAQVF